MGNISGTTWTSIMFVSVGRSAMSRGSTAMDRQMVGESRIVRRRMQRPKEVGEE
jgi:hypothetical protein